VPPWWKTPWRKLCPASTPRRIAYRKRKFVVASLREPSKTDTIRKYAALETGYKNQIKLAELRLLPYTEKTSCTSRSTKNVKKTSESVSTCRHKAKFQPTTTRATQPSVTFPTRDLNEGNHPDQDTFDSNDYRKYDLSTAARQRAISFCVMMRFNLFCCANVGAWWEDIRQCSDSILKWNPGPNKHV